MKLFERHFYDGSHFYRVVPKFLVQFGISYSEDKALQRFARTKILDDPPKGIAFRPGIISYAGKSAEEKQKAVLLCSKNSFSLWFACSTDPLKKKKKIVCR